MVTMETSNQQPAALLDRSELLSESLSLPYSQTDGKVANRDSGIDSISSPSHSEELCFTSVDEGSVVYPCSPTFLLHPSSLSYTCGEGEVKGGAQKRREFSEEGDSDLEEEGELTVVLETPKTDMQDPVEVRRQSVSALESWIGSAGSGIDCAGILKLRNSDIELRKGETDIGRKNTRVRLVFRVHIAQPNGRTVSLQTASNPIECSQRSAQELPLVEKQSLDSYPATGGKMMLLSGLNFLPESKVVFVEKAQDGHHLWEAEAKVDKDSVKSSTIVVEVPPYKNQRISSPVQVNFYVCNGKRKRSQYQRFTYLPPNVPIIKTEPNDDYDSLGSVGLSVHSKHYYGQPRLNSIMPVADPDACLVAGYPPCLPSHAAITTSSASSSPTLHDLSPVAYNKCLSSSPTNGAPPAPHCAPYSGDDRLP
ncbi:Nuclear factor of activated T-cells, cytoplasmic 1 [Oryzias melastigma]|uniref:Nuclear factor of activated T-cells, cytoplasmic 1 n=1 Tax=Oryzias melastigma TaxID=30732 RepID=A0A834L385_ORYME|nr:Nuclear factor of activated T-cells, cytoplasmic 1 [Oryzias melastigma]